MRCATCWRAPSTWSPRGCGCGFPRWAAASAPRATPTRTSCCWHGSRGGSDGRCGGSRPARRACSACRTAGRSCSSWSWGAAGTGRCSPTVCGCCRTPGPTCVSPRSCRPGCGNYRIPRVEAGGRSLVTSTVPVGPYRGAGRPEATMAIERAIDLFAAEAGLDPVEVRRRNLVSADAFPWTTATGAVYDSGDYQRALDLVLEAGGYQAARAEQARRRERGGPLRLGIGVALYVEVAGGGEHLSEYGAVEVTRDGAAVVRTGSCATGQGHETTWAMIASEQLGIPVERITVLRGDTAEVARGAGTIGSRSTQSGGVAVHRAAVALRERAVELAAGLLEASPEDVVLDRDAGRFHLAGAPTVSRTWAELAAASDRGGSNSRLAAEVDLDDGALTYPSGAYLAVVEVDTDTGQVRLRRLVAVDDAGNILNPLLAEGQLHGSIAQGVAQALYEEFRYDDDANPLSGTLQVYGPPTAADLPAFDLVELETPSPRNDLGVKGLGEAGCIGAPPAVLGAVVDALAPLGVRHLDMPATPERVWQAIRAARRAGPPWA